MYDKLHLHCCEGETGKTYRHKHKFSGITSKNPDFNGHTHYVSGYLEDVLGHIHYYSFITGPSYKVREGHMHFFIAFTTMNKRHYHYIKSYTSVYSDY